MSSGAAMSSGAGTATHLADSQSSLVLVGQNFVRSMFDERELFGGDLDRSRTLFGRTEGDFHYSSGTGTGNFHVSPERISLSAQGTWSDELLDAANRLGSMFKALPSHNVERVGITFEAIFRQRVDGPSGLEVCERLVGIDTLKDMLGYEIRYALPRAAFLRGGLQYEVRLEPHFKSGGANLYLNVQVDQEIDTTDDLTTRLTAIPDVRTYVAQLCQRVDERLKR